MNEISRIINNLQGYQYTLSNEMVLQDELFSTVLKNEGFIKEFSLNKKSRIDFYHPDLKIGIEVKIKGSATSIYRQCERYILTNKIKTLILLTAKSMGMPEKINEVPVIVVSLGRSWL